MEELKYENNARDFAFCVSYISKKLAVKIREKKVIDMIYSTGKSPNEGDLVDVCQNMGLNSRIFKTSPENLKMGLPMPFIAQIVGENATKRYVVITSIGHKHVFLVSPVRGSMKVTFDDFADIWTGIVIFLMPGNILETNKNISFFKGVFKYYFSQLDLTLGIILASILYTLLGIAGIIFLKYWVDNIYPEGLSIALKTFLIGVLIIIIFRLVLNFYRNYLCTFVEQKLKTAFIMDYFGKFLNLSYTYLNSKMIGEIVAKLNNCGKLFEAVSGISVIILIDTLMVILGILAMVYFSVTLTIVVVTTIVLCFFVIMTYRKALVDSSINKFENESKLNAFLTDIFNAAKYLKNYNPEKKLQDMGEKKFIKTISGEYKFNMVKNTEKLAATLILSLGLIAILWSGANDVIELKLKLGDFIAFLALVIYFFENIKNYAILYPKLQEARAVVKELKNIFNDKLNISLSSKEIKPSSLLGDIEYRNVEFWYDKSQPILRNINFSISKGEHIAIVGSSGSGKSTLVKLLLGNYPIQKGEILIEGLNIFDIDNKVINEKIAYVPREDYFFYGTIRDNLALGNPYISLDEIIDAAKTVYANNFINMLPKRYNTVIGEDGVILTKSQRQLLALTRAILKQPDVLILDEALDQVEAKLDRKIEKSIFQSLPDTTIIRITDRLGIVKGYTKIVLMDNGEIIESGSHKTLLSRRSYYYSLWNSTTSCYS